MNDCIKVVNLSKSYEGRNAVNNISFNVKRNEIFAFLGPNGAGKSTMISILSTLCDYDSGDVYVEGFKRNIDDDNIRSMLGVVFQGSMLDETLSVQQNLHLRAGLYGFYHGNAKKRVEEIVTLCSLQSIRHQLVKQLSGGQRRRVDIARALIPSPKLLILDEPSTGLDPKARQELWTTIKALKEKSQMSIFMTTHYMEEAEIADHICMIHKGHIVLDGSKDELKKQYQKDRVLLYSSALKQVARMLQDKRFAYEIKESFIAVEVNNFFQLMSLLRMCEMCVHHVEMEKGTIEDMYLTLLKEETTCE